MLCDLGSRERCACSISSRWSAHCCVQSRACCGVKTFFIVKMQSRWQKLVHFSNKRKSDRSSNKNKEPGCCSFCRLCRDSAALPRFFTDAQSKRFWCRPERGRADPSLKSGWGGANIGCYFWSPHAIDSTVTCVGRNGLRIGRLNGFLSKAQSAVLYSRVQH